MTRRETEIEINHLAERLGHALTLAELERSISRIEALQASRTDDSDPLLDKAFEDYLSSARSTWLEMKNKQYSLDNHSEVKA
jgi:hypothetical protein